MGGRSGWWLLLLSILYFANTLVGGIASVVFFFLFVGPKIAVTRGKSPWLGPLLFLPPISFVVWGYLAFSKDTGGSLKLPMSRGVPSASGS